LTAAPERVPAGRVGRPHGLDGSFYVTGARPRLLVQGTAVTVGGETREIVRRAGTEQRPIVRLEGLEDRDAAAALRGLELSVPAVAAPALGEDEYWAHELEGCEVFADERPLGRVTRLIELPSCEALEVGGVDGPGGAAGAGGPPFLVPMVKEAILEVDVAARRIEVDPEFLGLDQKQP
jgi:16S rRNA processing protein RimM